MNSPSVLIFAPLCYPPDGAEAIVTSKLVLAMIEAGWKVRVISQADFGNFYPADDNDNWRPLVSVVENIAGIDEKSILARLPGKKLTKKLRTLFWIIKAVRSGFVSFRNEKFDFLMSRAAPYYGHLPALIIRMFIKIPWIANWSDPMPAKKAPPPYGQGVHAKLSLLSNFYNSMVYRFAGWHTYPCERLMKYYRQMAPEIKEKCSVIPHIALRKFRIKATQDKNIFSVCHTGSVSNRDLSVFFDGLKRFINEVTTEQRLRVIFIGNPIDEIRYKIEKTGLSNIVQAKAPISYEATQIIAASASVLLVIEAQCKEGIFFPSKFSDFSQTGRPILALSPKEGTLSDILNRYGGGIAVDNRSPIKVHNALNTLYKAWKIDPLMPAYSSKNLINHFCADVVISKYKEILSRFIND